MEQEYQTRFSSALLTSVFAGLVATLLCMAYYLGYKEITGFPFSAILNVSSLIFGINVLFVLIGLVYSFFTRLSKGEIEYIVLFIIVTGLAVYGALHAHRSNDALLNREFRELLAGLVIIIGVSAFALVPFLYHNRKFIDKVL